MMKTENEGRRVVTVSGKRSWVEWGWAAGWEGLFRRNFFSQKNICLGVERNFSPLLAFFFFFFSSSSSSFSFSPSISLFSSLSSFSSSSLVRWDQKHKARKRRVKEKNENKNTKKGWKKVKFWSTNLWERKKEASYSLPKLPFCGSFLSSR